MNEFDREQCTSRPSLTSNDIWFMAHELEAIMRIKRATFTQEYKVFAIGERIRPCSRRSGLPDGVYTVTDYYPPLESSEVGVVFVAGGQYGMDACYFEALPFQDTHAMEADSGAGPDAHIGPYRLPSPTTSDIALHLSRLGAMSYLGAKALLEESDTFALDSATLGILGYES